MENYNYFEKIKEYSNNNIIVNDIIDKLRLHNQEALVALFNTPIKGEYIFKLCCDVCNYSIDSLGLLLIDMTKQGDIYSYNCNISKLNYQVRNVTEYIGLKKDF